MPDTKSYTVVGLGELLWDVFPKGKELGGAPANFAYMTSLLGDQGIVASRVGNDALGRTAGRRLERIGLRSKYLQIDTTYPTGTVKVHVDPAGQPTFEIAESVAWDFFEWTPEWQRLASTADAVCFGSLAQRSSQSRTTIRSFLKEVGRGTTRVFDVNLRQAFYSAETLAESMKLTDIVKLNQEELPMVVKLLGHTFQDDERAARWLRDSYNLRIVCVTRGAKGSLLVSGNDVERTSGLSGCGGRHCRFRRRVHRRAGLSLSAAWFSGHAERGRKPHGGLGCQSNGRDTASRRLLPATNPFRCKRRRIAQR